MLTLQIVIIVVLVLFNGFLSASEASIIASRKTRLQLMADEGSVGAQRTLDLAEHPSRFLATIQVGISLSAFFASAVGAVSLVGFCTRGLRAIPLGLISDHATALALVVETAALAFLTTVFGENVPKTIAVQSAEAVAIRIARPLEIVGKITQPIAFFVTGATNILLRLAGSGARVALPSITRSELLAMLEAAEDEGIVESTDADLIEEAFGFGDTAARSVMVPRVDMAAVEGTMLLRDIVERFFETGYSRLPVYRESLDDIIGVLHVKDVFRMLLSTETRPELTASDVMRPAYFVPESKPIDELLSELQARRTQLAVVIDEFGGVAGLVTLEDVIEELVGEIADEFDPGYEPFQIVEPGVIEVDGRVPIADLLDRLDIERDALGLEVEAESVGGLISYFLGRIPAAEDVVTAGPLRFQVKSMNGNRVSKVIVYDEQPSQDEGFGEPSELNAADDES
ncbi:MAG: hemolysin family protein [Nitrolancea sp.]